MEQYSRRVTWLHNAKPGYSLELWHYPLCHMEYHVVATVPDGELRSDFSTQGSARKKFEEMSEEMAV